MDTTVNALSILFNLYLLYLVKYYSTFGVKLYQYLLAMDAFLDLCLSIATFLAQPVPMSGNFHLIYMSNGFFADHSSKLDSYMIKLFIYLLHVNILWIPVQFAYRYQLLCKPNSKRGNMLIATIATLYTAFMLTVIVNFMEVQPELQTDGRFVLELNQWPKEFGIKKFFMVYYVGDLKTILWVSLWALNSVASVFVVVCCELGIVRHFKQMGTPTNSNTQKMHKEFHRALLAMAICPLITTAIPVFYFCFTIAWGFSPGRVTAIMATVLSSITLFNPLTTIVCFRCYREATYRLWERICGGYIGIATVGTTTSTVNNSVVPTTAIT